MGEAMDTFRQLWAVIILVILALLSPGTVQVDGTARGVALGGLRCDLFGGRRLALAFVQYRPGRVYWRAAVGVGA